MNKKNVPAIVVGIALVLSTIQVLAATNYFQGFETDTVDWSVGVTQVPSGNNGVPSAAGDFHAEAPAGSFTRFGGYESMFPAGGYTTSVDVHLNVEAGYTNDTRFDWSSAINKPDGTHRRDFVFNAGFYNDGDGSVPRFVISASNNTGRANSFPKNPGRNPISITETGWYTFEHRFYNQGQGVLAVDLRITTLSGDPVHTWTLSDATDVIGDTVGGHRYGWFATHEFPVLAIDNVNLLSVNLAGNVNACKNGGWQQFVRHDGTTFKNQGDCIQYVNEGK